MNDFAYKKGLKHAKTFEKTSIVSDSSERGKYINFIKTLAAKYDDKYLLGIADGLWLRGV